MNLTEKYQIDFPKITKIYIWKCHFIRGYLVPLPLTYLLYRCSFKFSNPCRTAVLHTGQNSRVSSGGLWVCLVCDLKDPELVNIMGHSEHLKFLSWLVLTQFSPLLLLLVSSISSISIGKGKSSSAWNTLSSLARIIRQRKLLKKKIVNNVNLRFF